MSQIIITKITIPTLEEILRWGKIRWGKTLGLPKGQEGIEGEFVIKDIANRGGYDYASVLLMNLNDPYDECNAALDIFAEVPFRPVVHYKGTGIRAYVDYPVGSKITILGVSWTVVENGVAFCDYVLGKAPFYEYENFIKRYHLSPVTDGIDWQTVFSASVFKDKKTEPCEYDIFDFYPSEVSDEIFEHTFLKRLLEGAIQKDTNCIFINSL